MANLLTTLRLALLFVFVGMSYAAAPTWQLAAAPLLAVIFILDGVDGYVARRRNEQTEFGALYDIAADRVVEYVLWIVAAHLGLAPVWAAIIFCTRGVLVDVVRTHFARRGQTPFGMMHTRLGRWLVSGRLMRVTYAALKMTAFGWIFGTRALAALDPDRWGAWAAVEWVTLSLVTAAVCLCVVRGVPVLIDAMLAVRAEHAARRIPRTVRQEKPRVAGERRARLTPDT